MKLIKTTGTYISPSKNTNRINYIYNGEKKIAFLQRTTAVNIAPVVIHKRINTVKKIDVVTDLIRSATPHCLTRAADDGTWCGL